MDWIVQNTPRVRNSLVGSVDTGNKILFGTINVPSTNTTNFRKEVFFGNYFNPDATPVVQVTVRSATEHAMWLRVFGLTSTNTISGDGFVVRGQNYSSNLKKKNMITNSYVDWVAFGW